MRAGILDPEVMRTAGGVRCEVEVMPGPTTEHLRFAERDRWDPARFGWEQICGLVRQVFSSSLAVPVRQVVFSAVDPKTDIHPICIGVAESLARETRQKIAVVGLATLIESGETIHNVVSGRIAEHRNMPIRHGAKRLRNNLWLLPPNEGGEDGVSMSSTQAQLSDLRREFEYSIVEARPAGESDEAMAMAQFADGIILVLSARHTRRATALKIKEALVAAEANLLGTVLSDREFPIPERIYRRL